MHQYNLLALSPLEFENISRDPLQKHLGIYLESFATGRDSGVDFRRSIDKNNQLIVQAKRHSHYRNLLAHLKNEVKKVEQLKPVQYILTTSVSLTKGNKDEILALFKPYILGGSDIFGADDIMNLLGTYEDILHRYYKLWLTDTAVLQRILHAKIYNQSAFELEEIQGQVKLFVQNDSFHSALDILQKYRYLIISGLPGIGKTTLARILILYLLSNDFTEFIFLNGTIDDAYETFPDGKRQVYLFDDFLGTNFFDYKPAPKEDSRIVKFIKRITSSQDKLFILTTREYVLNQAKATFESFNLHNIDLAKCVLDLSSYTNVNKAQILYNHLFFADVPIEHLSDLLVKEQYRMLVLHRNFNPRIIEAIVGQRIWERIQPEQFSKSLLTFFDNPESVWLYAYENALDKFSQYALLVLLTQGTPTFLRDWEAALSEFLSVNSYKYLLPFDSITFYRSIRILENTFIRTQKDYDGEIGVEYQNPSIQDFLINYLRGKHDLIESLLSAMIYIEQSFAVFTTSTKKEQYKIELTAVEIEAAMKRILSQSILTSTCRTIRFTYRNREGIRWHKAPSSGFNFLENIFRLFAPINSSASEYVYRIMQENLYIRSESYSDRHSYTKLLTDIDLTKLQFEEERLLDWIIEGISWLLDVELFAELEQLFPSQFKEKTQTDNFDKKVSLAVENEINFAGDGDLCIY